MTIYTWPALRRKAPLLLDWALVPNTQVFQSPLSGAAQTVEMPGARWRASFTMENLDAEDSALLRVFMARLRGQSGRFYLWHLGRPTPRGPATGAPMVSGAGQSGTSLLTSGWTPGTTGILKAGDYFGVNGELKMLVADAHSNDAGATTLVFEPPLRVSPANAAAITTTRPTATFKLDEDAMRWLAQPAQRDSFPMAATETW